MFTKTEEWNALPSQKMVMTLSFYGKGEWLVSLIGNLLKSWRNSYGNIKKLIQKAEENVYAINYKYLTTNVDDKLIAAIEYIIQALKGLKELED